jgi:pantothenate kinase-related protein Tda10
MYFSGKNILDNIPSVQVEHNSANACLPGTRTHIIDEVINWAKCTDVDNPCIFWLQGMAGQGKSSIATSVACHLEDENLLGTSFFFSRDNVDHHHLAFGTIALSLSRHNAHI